jgi:glycosyltransferase involved in cell wall biosynthesis
MNQSNPALVLLVLPWSPNLPGGVSVVVSQLQKEMIASSVLPMIVVNNWDAPNPTVDAEGFINFRFALFGNATSIAIAKALIGLPLRVYKTLKLLREHNVGSVNFHYPSTDAFLIALLKRLKLYKGSLVLSFHGTDVQSPKTLLAKGVWGFIWKSVGGVSTCSMALAKQVSETFGISVNKVTVIYNGVNSTLFSPTAGLHGFSNELPKQYIVSIGSYIPRKGHAILLDALSILASEFPDLALVIVGMDGPERQLLIEQADRLGITDRITCMVGLSPENVAAVTANATLCVQPSLAEPFGLAVIEAGACGVPVVASAVGGHLELIDDKETGFLFASKDHVQCAEILRELLLQPEKGVKAAESFRKKILEEFTWASCAQGYLRLMAL